MEHPLHHRHRMQVRHLVHLSLLAGLAGGCVDEIIPGAAGDCTIEVHKTLTVIQPIDPQMQFRIDSCKADVDACNDLCTMAMTRNSIDGNVTKCDVTFHDAGDVEMNVTFQQFVGGPNCPVPEPTIGSGGAGGGPK